MWFCVCFKCNFNIDIESLKLDPFLKFPHQNLNAIHLYFLRATCLNFIYIWSTEKKCELWKSWSISAWELHPPSVISSFSNTPLKKVYFVEIFNIFSRLISIRIFHILTFLCKIRSQNITDEDEIPNNLKGTSKL